MPPETGFRIRYHALWVRVLCCLAVAIGIGHAVRTGVLLRVDDFLRALLVGSDAQYFGRLEPVSELWLVGAMCLLPSVPRIDRPVTMIAYGTGLLLAYVAAIFGFLIGMELILPLAAPMTGLLVSTALMETMAWSEERSRRRCLEDLERVRQQFADMLVHDLRKRMSSILMSVSVLEQGRDRESRNAGVLATIRTSADRMVTLIDSLLDIRRMEQGVFALTLDALPVQSLLDAVAAECGPAAELTGIRFRVGAAPECSIRVDRAIFARIFANLIWNALQHAPEDSEIVLECRRNAVDGILQFAVGNRGPVISPADRERLFLPLVSGSDPVQRGAEGTMGLGLTFCKLAVEAHGGSISIESPWVPHPDGVCVTVRLPCLA